MRHAWAFVAALLLAACAAAPAPRTDARNELTPNGAMRVAINHGNPVLARKDPSTGELRGVTVDLAQVLGRRIEVPVELVGYDTIAKLLAGWKAGETDVAFLAVDPARAGEMTFTEPYMEVEVTYAVPEGSDASDVSQVDRAGRRIAVQEKNAADLFLSRTLKEATLVRAPNNAAAFAAMKAGNADAFAGNRADLQAALDAAPGYRVVQGRFTTIPHAIAVAPQRQAAAASLRGFVADVKRSGIVQRAIDENGLRGVVVAGPRP